MKQGCKPARGEGYLLNHFIKNEERALLSISSKKRCKGSVLTDIWRCLYIKLFNCKNIVMVHGSWLIVHG